ncbi:MAG: dTDP-4-keto-6-deoxy-D-glucose epimerase [Alphaproteobacteria bacterium]|nr:dTDP-4-keto-6-deoxy-D-glucose epimerase [Alphaproteobacteria bacterium]
MSGLKVERTRLDGVLLIHPLSMYEDFRGDYVETYNEAAYHAAGIVDRFIQDDYATSGRHVLRGVHGDNKTVKLISCPYGRLYVNVVNNDPASRQYRQWQGFTLSSDNRLQVYIPARFGNAYLVMSDVAVFHYKQTTYYDRAGQFTIKWNDPDYKMWWPVRDPILSERDYA